VQSVQTGGLSAWRFAAEALTAEKIQRDISRQRVWRERSRARSGQREWGPTTTFRRLSICSLGPLMHGLIARLTVALCRIESQKFRAILNVSTSHNANRPSCGQEFPNDFLPPVLQACRS